MTSKQTNTFREEIEALLKVNFIPVNRKGLYGKGIDEIKCEAVADIVLALFQKVVDKACPDKKIKVDKLMRRTKPCTCHHERNGKRIGECLACFNDRQQSMNAAKNNLTKQIRASFKDIVSGKIEL